MAQPTGTYSAYQAKGLRENLTDVIYNIAPTETPFVSNAGKGSATGVYHEWQTDTLAAPDGNNAAIEGDEAAGQPSSPTNRLGNYCQIMRKQVTISGTLEAVNKAGRKNELAYQMAKRGQEIKRDMETRATGNYAAVIGNDTTARQTAGFEAFIRTNVSRGTGGASGTLSGTTDGYPNAAATDGTQRAFTEALLKQVIQSVWTEGGDLKMLMVGAGNKVAASGFTGIATRFRDVPPGKQAQIIGAADVYVSDFGELSIVPNRFQRNRTALLVDPDMVSIVTLRPFQTIPLAKTGDSEKRLMLVEWALKVHNEKAHGVIADLT